MIEEEAEGMDISKLQPVGRKAWVKKKWMLMRIAEILLLSAEA